MKKLLFVSYGLGIGGIETCLVNLLNVLPEEKYDVDVLLMNPEYDMKPRVRRRVCYLDSFRYVMNTTDTMREIREHGGVLKNFPKFLSYCRFRVRVKLRLKGSWMLFRPLEKDYDVAVAYSQNDYSPYYVIDCVRAKRKVLWYHNGAYERSEKLYARDRRYYSLFDDVVAVSTDCARMLAAKFPLEQGRLIVLRNICDTERIIKLGGEGVPESFHGEGVHITTVGRMTAEKGADLALEACRLLLDRGCDVFWHWVGSGNQCDAVKQRIQALGLSGRFIPEGDQSNPYPYIKNCCIYVQPSHFEAYSTTVTEARVLQKPIVTTDVGGMRDQLEDGVNGLIVPIDAEKIADGIERLIADPCLRAKFSDALRENQIDNEKALSAYEQTVFA